MISRRQFLIGAAGAAAGLILPEWLLRAERFIDGEGAPYLETPDRYRDTLHATDWGDGQLELSLGDPRQDIPRLTWEEYAQRYFGMTFDELAVDCWGLEPRKAAEEGLTAEGEVPYWEVLDQWVHYDSPSAAAFTYLESLDLGRDFGAAGGLGQINFIDGPAPGNDSRIVTVPDNLSLSLLQKRLNDLGEVVRTVVDVEA
jgi:hypothetical protein